MPVGGSIAGGPPGSPPAPPPPPDATQATPEFGHTFSAEGSLDRLSRGDDRRCDVAGVEAEQNEALDSPDPSAPPQEGGEQDGASHGRRQVHLEGGRAEI